MTQFQHLSRELGGARALWAVLTLNEYFSQGDILGKAMRSKARATLTARGAQLGELEKRILSGAKLSEFSVAERSSLEVAERSRKEGESTYTTRVYTMRGTRKRLGRKGARQALPRRRMARRALSQKFARAL